MVAALASLHETLPATEAQRRQLARLGQDGTLVVVTGQQAGLLGGPLFTTYKAMGALATAAAAEQLLGRPVVPVFWVASEDHDFSEVRQLRLAAPDGALVQLALPGSGDFRSAGDIPVPPEARHLIGELEALFPPTATGGAFAAGLRESLRRLQRPTLAGWFTQQLHLLLGDRGLLFYDPMLPGLRACSAPVLAGAASRAAAAGQAIAEAGALLRQVGYAPGLELEPDHVHLFVYHDGRRLALHAVDGRVRTRGGEVDLPLTDLARRVLEQPTAFSPNVALRPVVQDFTLPVLAQLGGPGEVAYLAQLDGVFRLWDRPAPIVSPRPGATIVLPEDDAALQRCDGPALEALRADVTAVVERAVASRSTLDLDAVFAAERSAVRERYARLQQLLQELSPHMAAIVRGNAERVLFQLEYLERKAHQHRRRAHRDLATALRQAAGRLFPGGALQERNSCVYAYVFRWGADFLEALAQAVAAEKVHGRHLVLHWEPED